MNRRASSHLAEARSVIPTAALSYAHIITRYRLKAKTKRLKVWETVAGVR
jgi:hypothetical protein